MHYTKISTHPDLECHLIEVPSHPHTDIEHGHLRYVSYRLLLQQHIHFTCAV